MTDKTMINSGMIIAIFGALGLFVPTISNLFSMLTPINPNLLDLLYAILILSGLFLIVIGAKSRR